MGLGGGIEILNTFTASNKEKTMQRPKKLSPPTPVYYTEGGGGALIVNAHMLTRRNDNSPTCTHTKKTCWTLEKGLEVGLSQNWEPGMWVSFTLLQKMCKEKWHLGLEKVRNFDLEKE